MQYLRRKGILQETYTEETMNIADLSRSQIETLIDEWIIGKNAERDRAVLKRRLLDGICYEPLAEEFNLSVQRVKTIVYKREAHLFKHLPG